MICNHGTYDGFFLDVVLPMASSISFRSSGEMRGCTAGDSKIITNHKIDQINPMPPIYFMVKHSKEIRSVNWLTMYCKINKRKRSQTQKKPTTRMHVKSLRFCCHVNMGRTSNIDRYILFIPVFILHLFVD